MTDDDCDSCAAMRCMPLKHTTVVLWQRSCCQKSTQDTSHSCQGATMKSITSQRVKDVVTEEIIIIQFLVYLATSA